MKTNNDTNIYEAIQEAVSLKEYCENNGINFIKIGKQYRANSPFSGARNAFSIDIDTPNLWYDYADEIGGDVIEFSALFNHNGNKREALVELLEYLPEKEREKFSPELTRCLKECEELQNKIQHSHEALLSGQYQITTHWLEYLHSRGIDNRQISRLKIGFDMNGFRLLIPRLDRNAKEFKSYNTRRMPNTNGYENEKEDKYRKAANNTFVHDIPLGLHTLSRECKYLVLTEGDFDALNFEREGFAVVGKFNNKFWPEILNNAEKREAGAVLAFDNDEQGQKYTQEAAQRLFERGINFCVVQLPADCKDVNDFYRTENSLQALIDNAIDDLEYLALCFAPSEGFEKLTRAKRRELQDSLKKFLTTAIKHGADETDIIDLCGKLSACYPLKWLDAVLEEAKKGACEADIVEHLCEKYLLKFNERTGFYRYDEHKGIWLQQDDKAIGALVREYLGKTASAKKIYNIVEHLKSAVNSNETIEKLDRLNLFAFQNGTLHFTKQKGENEFFKTPSATDFVTRRVQYAYDENATCPAWLKALNIIFGGDKRRIECLQEFFGYCLLPHCKFQKALILRDKSTLGSNGKSTILDVFSAVIGEQNCTSLEPCQFADNFSVIRLKGAKVNICSDIKTNSAGDFTGGEANLKKAITGDMLNGCHKHKDFIEFKNTAKIIFAVNGYLMTKDKTGSMQRRFLIIDCVARFIDGEPLTGSNEVKKDTHIKEKLMKELAGIFNWCLEGAKRIIRQNGIFTLTAEQERLNGVFKTNTESVEAFVDEAEAGNYFYDVNGKGRKVLSPDLYDMYCEYCENDFFQEHEDFEILSRTKFHEAFRAILNARNFKYEFKPDRIGNRVGDCYRFK